MKELLSSYKTLENKQTSTESKLIDLQCRSMCENLVFSGIEKQNEEMDDGAFTENTEKVVYDFLSEEMGIPDQLPLDRLQYIPENKAYYCQI